MTNRVTTPTGLVGFSIFNLVVGVLYGLIGLLGFLAGSGFVVSSYVVSSYFALSGVLLVVGSAGVLAGRRWSQRFATWGLALVVSVNGLISFILAVLLVFWLLLDRLDAAGGDVRAAFALFIGFTMVQLLGFFRLRRADVAEFLWAQTEAELDVGAHEKITLDFDHSDSVESVRETNKATADR